MKKETNEQQTGNLPLIKRLENFIFGKYDIRINVISNDLEGKLKNQKTFSVMSEDKISYELYSAGFNKFSQQLSVLISEKAHKYDPFKEYFESLPKWDETQPDYIKILSDYVKVEDANWWQRMFKKFLVRMVAQSIVRIPFNKQCLTLVGKQNDGKTSFIEFLIPPALSNYYKKGFDFRGNKDGKISLVQNFMINLDELAQFDKKDLNNEFKAILSESSVKFRPLFAKNEVSHDRRASFVASTNKHEFLTDETGNVRWLPFVINEITHDGGGDKGYGKNVDINMVWAQAYSLLQSGFQFEMVKEEIEIQEKINMKFMTTTTEMELIQKFYRPSSKEDKNAMFLTSSDIERELMITAGIKVYRVQIGKALKILRFQESSKFNSITKFTQKGYYVVKV